MSGKNEQKYNCNNEHKYIEKEIFDGKYLFQCEKCKTAFLTTKLRDFSQKQTWKPIVEMPSSDK